MADFARLGEAVGGAPGWPVGTFVATYNANRRESTVMVLEESMLAMVLLDCAALGETCRTGRFPRQRWSSHLPRTCPGP